MKLIKRNKQLFLNDVKLCDTLDPGILEPGTYRLEINYSKRFKKELPLIYNDEFPAARGFRIHQGNFWADTNGCILVGRRVADGVLADSLKTLEYVMTLIKLNKVEVLEIEDN